ncbi:MAG: hypothetical protein RLZZ361_496 [Cyanobacteriota bacterium]|jgi:hypothetical protein
MLLFVGLECIIKNMRLYKFFILALIFCIINNSVAFANDIQIDLQNIPLSSRLKGDYMGYKFTIMNRSNSTLEIVNAQVVNGQDGSMAARMVADGSGVGPMWAIMGPAGLFTFGIAWLVGLVATPILFVTDSGRNKKAKKEGQTFNNIVDLGPLLAGNTIELQTLVPIGAKPQLKLTYKLPNSSNLLMISR